MNTKSIIRTSAVVLRSVEYGETSEIVTFYTQRFGRITGIAKGSRNAKSRFGSTLQPMSCVDLVYYSRPTRSVQTITETSHLTRFDNLLRDLKKITVGLRCVELVNAMMIEGESHPQVFDLLVNCLTAVDGEHERPENVLPHFQLQLADELGFSPSFEKEDVEAVSATGGSLFLPDGAIGPVTVGRDFRVASRSALRAFAVFSRASLSSAMRMEIREPVSREVQDLIEAYYRFHVETQFPMRAANVTSQLFQSGIRS